MRWPSSTRASISPRTAGAYTMPGVIVDGNDALEVHAATGDASPAPPR